MRDQGAERDKDAWHIGHGMLDMGHGTWDMGHAIAALLSSLDPPTARVGASQAIDSKPVKPKLEVGCLVPSRDERSVSAAVSSRCAHWVFRGHHRFCTTICDEALVLQCRTGYAARPEYNHVDRTNEYRTVPSDPTRQRL